MSYGDSLAFYESDAIGSARPVAWLEGCATTLSTGYSGPIALDATGRLFVARSANDIAHEAARVLVFDAGSNGNAAPLATLSGPTTELQSISSLAVDAEGLLYVAQPGEILVFANGAEGDAAPLRKIQGASPGSPTPTGLAVDGQGDLFVCDIGNMRVLRFAPGAAGSTAPTAVLGGLSTTRTGLFAPEGLAIDATGALYVVDIGDQANVAPSVRIFPAGAVGDVAPIGVVAGAQTGLSMPLEVAVSPTGALYVLDENLHVLVFPPGASGDASSEQLFEAPENVALMP